MGGMQVQSKRGTWPSGIENVNRGMLGGETQETIYLRAQERTSPFPHFPLYHLIPDCCFPQDSVSVGTFRAVFTYYADERLCLTTVYPLQKWNKVMEMYLRWILGYEGRGMMQGWAQLFHLLCSRSSELRACRWRGWHGLSQLREKNNPIHEREQALT